MVETFTPAVCGSRNRQRLALVGFALGALAASAAVGAALGALGGLLGMELALAVAALALLAAAREAGLMRLPLPQSRRQVPERWRSALPLPVWSVGYGAGLGAGFLTFQPVATFWVACAAAVALGRPAPAAACFAAYGAGRALMAILPRRGKQDATAAVEALVRRRRALLAVNVVALLVCAALLSAPTAGAATMVGAGFDPAAQASALARAKMNGGGITVLVEPKSGQSMSIPGAASPALDGDLLAYADGGGIKVVNWRTDQPVAQIDGPVSEPAVDWPLLAYIRTGTEKETLFVADFTGPGAPTRRKISSAARENDLGRPSLAGGRIAWHVVTRRYSKVLVQSLGGGNRQLIRQSKIAVESNPAITRWRIVWVEQRAGSAWLLTRQLGQSSTRRIYKVKGRERRLLTTALTKRTAYVTRWRPATGSSTLVRVNF
jgi:hypothetical protein